MPRPCLARNYALLLAVTTACTLRPPPGDSGDGSATDGMGTTGGMGTTSSDPATSTDAPTGSASLEPSTGPANTVEACGIVGCDTVATFDSTSDSTGPTTVSTGTTGPVPEDCPGFKQLDPDCPDGFKCTIDGGVQDTQCTPIVPRPQGLNEPCTVIGDAFSGLDDCDLGLVCWNVDDKGHGTCIGLCNETNGEFTCQDPAAVCTGLTCQSCLVSLCLAPCNPLLHQCGAGEVCIPDNDTFLCVPDASGDQGQLHGACEFVNGCDDGLACVDAKDAASECDDQVAGCCEPFCDLGKPDCPGMGQICTPWFANDPPAGLEQLGVCILK